MPPAFLAPLGLEPLVDAELEGLDRPLDVGRAGDRRERPAEDQVAGVVLGRKDAAAVVGQGEVATGVLIRVVVEVVLDAQLVQLHVREGVAEVDDEVDLVVQAVDVEQLALDVGIDLPERRVGPEPDTAPGPADRLAVDLVVPADELALGVGGDAEEVQVDRRVELVRRVDPAALERPVGVGDRVGRQVGEDRPVVDLGGRVDVRVVGPGVLEVGQAVAQERVAQAVVIPLGVPLGLGVERLEVGLGQQGERPVFSSGRSP